MLNKMDNQKPILLRAKSITSTLAECTNNIIICHSHPSFTLIMTECFSDTLEDLRCNQYLNIRNYKNYNHKGIKKAGELVAIIMQHYFCYINNPLISDSELTESETINKMIIFAEKYISTDIANDMRDKILCKNGKLRINYQHSYLAFFKPKTMKLKYLKLFKRHVMHQDMLNKEIGAKETRKNATNMSNHNSYVSKRAIKLVSDEKEDSRRAMSKIKVKSGKKLSDVVKSQYAKFTEMYLELNALEKLASERNMTWLFITLTCPPMYHSNPKNGNCSYDGSSVVDAKNYLQDRWRKLVRFISKKDSSAPHLKFGLETAFGKKIIEANQDGTPHFHLILFCHDSLVIDFKSLFKQFFGKKVDFRQKGFDQNGNRICDKSKHASAASYVSKYLLKQFGLEKNKKGEVKDSSLNKMLVWRSMTQFRSHSSFGYKSTITKYRMARALINESRQRIYRLKNEGLFADACHLETKHIGINESLNRSIPKTFTDVLANHLLNNIIDTTSLSSDSSYNLELTHTDLSKSSVLNNNQTHKEQKIKFFNCINKAEKKYNFKRKKMLVDYCAFMKTANNIQTIRDKRGNYVGLTNCERNFSYHIKSDSEYTFFDLILDKATEYRKHID
ncbi:replication endonuclease [Vibrio vulnificus]|nr:replication endonuclease [Vibrio vulnificus]